MPVEMPARLDLYFTRGSTYQETFDFPGRASELAEVSVQLVVKRRDDQHSPELLRLTAALSIKTPDPAHALIAGFTATSTQTAALPRGASWWALEVHESNDTEVFRQLEGRFIANE